MQVAASQLGVSMTTLKKLCRENNLDRWPFRKRKSLSQMTVRTKQALTDSEETDKVQIQAALDVLEHQRQRMRVSCAGNACTFLYHNLPKWSNRYAADQIPSCQFSMPFSCSLNCL